MDCFYSNFAIGATPIPAIIQGGGSSSDVNLVAFGSNFLNAWYGDGTLAPPPLAQHTVRVVRSKGMDSLFDATLPCNHVNIEPTFWYLKLSVVIEIRSHWIILLKY